MKQIVVVGLMVFAAGCAARSYVPQESRQNLNGGISAVSIDLVDGRCEVTLAVKGDRGRFKLRADVLLCLKASTATDALATVPKETK